MHYEVHTHIYTSDCVSRGKQVKGSGLVIKLLIPERMGDKEKQMRFHRGKGTGKRLEGGSLKFRREKEFNETSLSSHQLVDGGKFLDTDGSERGRFECCPRICLLKLRYLPRHESEKHRPPREMSVFRR